MTRQIYVLLTGSDTLVIENAGESLFNVALINSQQLFCLDSPVK